MNEALKNIMSRRSEEGRELLRQLGISGDYEGIGHCILGYPAGDIPAEKPRKENWVYKI